VKYGPTDSLDILGLLISEIRNRGYPLFETFISRSTKIESLYTNTDGSAKSILHSAPNSLVAKQMRWLARDVLAELRECECRAPLEGHESNDQSPATQGAQPTAPRLEPASAIVSETGDHRQLKHLIAANPARTLGEAGLKTLAVDCDLAMGDSIDVVLEDEQGRVIGVEICRRIPERDLVAIAQAIKHRAMVGNKWGREKSGTRAILASDTIPPQVRAVAEDYDVECVAVGSACSLQPR
jgi:hypothetical protein